MSSSVLVWGGKPGRPCSCSPARRRQNSRMVGPTACHNWYPNQEFATTHSRNTSEMSTIRATNRANGAASRAVGPGRGAAAGQRVRLTGGPARRRHRVTSAPDPAGGCRPVGGRTGWRHGRGAGRARGSAATGAASATGGCWAGPGGAGRRPARVGPAAGGPGGGVASIGSDSPIHPSPSQYRWVVGSAGSLYHPGAISLTGPP